MKRELLALCAAAARKSPLDVANCVRITKTYGYATDNTSSLRYEWDGPDMDACINAVALSSALADVPDDQQIKFHPDAGHVALQLGRRRIKLKTLEPKDMPEIVVSREPVGELEAAELAAAIEFCAVATNPKFPGKAEFGNIVIDFNGTPSAVATDGNRMHVFTLAQAKGKEPVMCHIPRALGSRLMSIGKMGGRVTLTRDRIILERGDLRFIGMLSGSVYPDWRKINPDGSGYKAKVIIGAQPAASIFSAMTRLGIVDVDITAESERLVFTGSERGEEFSDELPASVTGDASVCVSSRLLLDACSSISGELTIYMEDQKKPMILVCGERKAVVMGRRK